MESWFETIKKNNRAFLNSFKKDNWCPSNYNKETGKLYNSEEYKNIFLKLRFGGHIHDNSYFAILDRFEKKYQSDKNLIKKIYRYIELTNMNYRPIKNGGWRNPLNDIKGIGPMGIIPCVVDTELGKEYKKLEFELKEIFNKI